MPQLDPSSFSSQLFWLTVSFALLYALLSILFLPRVQSVLFARKQLLDSDLGGAARSKEQAEKLREHYESVLAEARTNAQRAIAEAQTAFQREAEQRLKELDASIAQKLKTSEVTILQSRQKVMQDLTPVAAELASVIIEMLVEKKPAASEVTALVGSLVKERAI